VSAMRAILKADPQAEILMIGAEPHPPYMRPPLSKELWFNEDKVESSQMLFNDWSGNKRTVFYPDKLVDLSELQPGTPALLKGVRVTKLDPTNQSVTLDDGREFKYGKCLLAPGGEPKNLAALEPTESAPCLSTRVHLFRNIAQYQHLSSELDSDAKVLVIGGGFVGSELAYAMTRTGATVFQSFPEAGNMGRVLPKYLSNWTTRQLEQAGVNVKPESKLMSTECKDEGVEVTFASGEKLLIDHILVAVGLQPSTDLGDSAGLEVHKEMGGYVVNAELEARSNLFVAGDAACFYDPVLGRRRVEHHDHAVVSGKLAGENMAGTSKPYHHQSMFWSDLGPNVGYEAIGLVDSSLPTVGIWAHKETEGSDIKVEPGANEKYEQGIVFYMDKNRVVGVVTWNIFGKIPIARQVIADGYEHHDFGKLAKQFDIHTKE